MVSQGERNPRQFIAAKDKISEHYSIERLSRSPAFFTIFDPWKNDPPVITT
jgi:hypothetical protein